MQREFLVWLHPSPLSKIKRNKNWNIEDVNDVDNLMLILNKCIAVQRGKYKKVILKALPSPTNVHFYADDYLK